MWSSLNFGLNLDSLSDEEKRPYQEESKKEFAKFYLEHPELEKKKK